MTSCVHATPQSELLNVINAIKTKYQLPIMSLSVKFPEGQSININSGCQSDGLYQVGSNTKFYTAALVLKLAELKMLDLNDPLSKWLPDYPKWSHVTILQLLNHTSGIKEYLESRFWWYKLEWYKSSIWQATDVVSIAYHYPLYFKSGMGWHYSNTDYVLLGMIIEKATQHTYQDNLNRYILNKIKPAMKYTYYAGSGTPDFIQKKMIHGFRNNEKDVTDINVSWLQAGGALISNPDDLSSAYAYIFSGKLLNTSSMKLLTQFVSIKTGQLTDNALETSYGLGVFSAATPYGIVWFTPGLTPGYTSLTAWLPCSHIAFSYAANSTPKKPGLHAELMTHILKILTAHTPHQCDAEPHSAYLQFPPI